jgi:hypothetical protein
MGVGIASAQERAAGAGRSFQHFFFRLPVEASSTFSFACDATGRAERPIRVHGDPVADQEALSSVAT